MKPAAIFASQRFDVVDVVGNAGEHFREHRLIVDLYDLGPVRVGEPGGCGLKFAGIAETCPVV